MAYSYYPANPDFNDAAVLLDLMSVNQIQKLIALIEARGPAVINDIKGKKRNSTANLSPLVVLDSTYIPSEDMEDTALGTATILCAAIRKPLDTPDVYEKVLKDAFGIPQEMAALAAKKIETADILGGNYKDGVTGAEYPWYTKYTDKMIEFAKKALNSLPGANLMGWEIDPTQKYDIDKLYEWKLLGGVVRELNSRSRFMAGQAALNQNSGAFVLGGDPEYGDPAEELGDAIMQGAIRPVPSEMMSGCRNLHAMGAAHIANMGSKVRNAMSKPNFHSLIRNKKLAKRLNRSVYGKHAMGDNAFGDSDEMGDIYGDAYSTISANYGSNPAAAWQMGDVEGFMKSVGQLGGSEYTTGDPELDAAIEDSVISDMAGDIEQMDPEIGGIFMRARINRQKRLQRRRKRRATRQDARQDRKDREARELQEEKSAARRSFRSSGLEDEEEQEQDQDQGYNDGGENNDLPFPEA